MEWIWWPGIKAVFNVLHISSIDNSEMAYYLIFTQFSCL